MSELERDEKDLVFNFLRSTLNVNASLSGNKVTVDPERLSLEELRKSVNKFVYHRNLNRRYWVALEGGVVKIHKFERAKKAEKRRREATPPSTIRHGW